MSPAAGIKSSLCFASLQLEPGPLAFLQAFLVSVDGIRGMAVKFLEVTDRSFISFFVLFPSLL